MNEGLVVRRRLAQPKGATHTISSLMRIASNSQAASWILPRLHRSTLDVCSVVPEGFDAYARIFHPPLKYSAAGIAAPVRWRDIAAANGRTVEEELLSLGISSDPARFGSSGEVLWDEQSHVGSLSLEIAVVLTEILRNHTRTPEKCWFGLWEGWGHVRARWPTVPTFSLPMDRTLLLFEGTLSDTLLTFADPAWIYRSANLWWPDDKTWCVATEIDFKWSYVAGSSACIEDVLHDPRIEAVPVTPTMRV